MKFFSLYYNNPYIQFLFDVKMIQLAEILDGGPPATLVNNLEMFIPLNGIARPLKATFDINSFTEEEYMAFRQGDNKVMLESGNYERISLPYTAVVHYLPIPESRIPVRVVAYKK